MIIRRRSALLGLAAAIIAAPMMALAAGVVPAAAGTIDAVDAEQLEAALDAAGLSPAMLSDSASGAPVAHGSAGAFSFFVRAMGCSGEPPACDTLMFFANFELGRDVSPADYRAVNAFNDSQVFGRAYVLERQSQVGVDYVIELGGGVTPDHLAENIGRWADVISAFVEAFREGAASS